MQGKRSMSIVLCGSLPSIILHHKTGHGLDLFLLEHKTLALVPAPGLLVLAHAAQLDFVGQLRSREGEQLPPERAALIGGRDKKLVEIKLRQMQRQHRRE